RGAQPSKTEARPAAGPATTAPASQTVQEELILVADDAEGGAAEPRPAAANLKTMAEVPHEYRLADIPQARAKLIKTRANSKPFAFWLQASAVDAKEARPIGLAL